MDIKKGIYYFLDLIKQLINWRSLIPIIILFFGFLIFYYIAIVAPVNMDEFSFYTSIMCHYYENNQLNTFYDKCGMYDLNFIGTGIYLPLRSFDYMGNSAALVYFPLFLIWKSYFSARLMGFIFILIQAFLLAKIFNFKWYYIFLGFVVFFPYFYQHIIDTSMVWIQSTLVFGCFYCFNLWFKTAKWRYSLISAVLLFFGFWSKLTFVWLLYGLIVILFVLIFINRLYIIQRKILFYQQFLLSLFLLIFLLFLYFGSYPIGSDKTYLEHKLGGDNQYTLSEMMNWNFIISKGTFTALLNPLKGSERSYLSSYAGFANLYNNYNLFTWLWVIVTYGFLPFILIILLCFKKIKFNEFILPLLFYLVFILTVFFVIKTRLAWSMHHTVLSFIFLIIAYLYLFKIFLKYNSIKFIYIFFVLFLLVNLPFYLTFNSQNVYSSMDRSNILVNSVLYDKDLANHYFYVIADWGFYFYQALYGNKNQSVLHLTPFDPLQVGSVIKLMKHYNRSILFIYDSKKHSTIKLINSSIKLYPCKLIPINSTWQILLEKGDNICFDNISLSNN